MDDTTIVGERVGVVQAGGWGAAPWGGLSWSAVIAGAVTAIAVTSIIIALGSGIGFTIASPYSYSPSAATMTVLGAVWLVFAQAVGFATGGYMAGRLRRNPADVHTGEVKFRDAANALTAWAIGVFVSTAFIATMASMAADRAAWTATGAAANQSIDYYTDLLLRPAAPAGAATGAPAAAPAAAAPPSAAPENPAVREQVKRVLVAAIAANSLANEDRTFLAQAVSAQTGLNMDDAQRRVDDVVNRARTNAAQMADTARQAAAYLSFWTFMSLLFGAVCAVLGGLLGGELRDEFATRHAVLTVPR